MTRVKRGKIAHKRRKRLLKQAKGFRWGRKTKYRLAKDALYHAWEYAYRDRRTKKRVMRRLWITRLNIAVRELGMKYSQLVKVMKDKKIEVDRKVLSQMAVENPKVFAKFIEKIK